MQLEVVGNSLYDQILLYNDEKQALAKDEEGLLTCY
jgi:hypothetical protein